MITVKENLDFIESKRMRPFLRRLKDLSPVYAGVQQFFADKIEESFDNFRDPYGNSWDPVKPDTLRKRKQTTDGILTDTRELRDGTVVSVVGDTVTITQPYPKSVHNYGIDALNVPARPSTPVDGLPLTWEAALNTAILGSLRKEFPWL